MRRRLLLVLAFCAGTILGAFPANAAYAGPDCKGLPLHTKFPVVDAAGVVDPEPEAYLDADLLLYHAQGGEALVEVTVTDLGGDDVSSYAKRLFDCWGVGDAKSDNGVLVLVAMTERRVRIELGAGLEGRIDSDRLDAAIAGMKAPLRSGDVGAALRFAATSVVADLGGTLPDTRASATPKAPGDVTDGASSSDALPQGYAYPQNAEPFAPDDSGGSGAGGMFLLFLVFGIGIPAARALFRGGVNSDVWGTPHPVLLHGGRWHDSSPSDSGSGWSGSSFSGGSSGPSSFGGGHSGGGGASGSW